MVVEEELLGQSGDHLPMSLFCEWSEGVLLNSCFHMSGNVHSLSIQLSCCPHQPLSLICGKPSRSFARHLWKRPP